MKNYGKLTLALVILWFVFALSASADHLFKNNANRFGVGVALAALVPVLIFGVWFAASKRFREFTLSGCQALTVAQSWRILGFTFVLLEARGLLPAIFALPAGYGDMFIGATATFAAWKLANPRHRRSFIFWQALGITDLVVAVTLGTTARLFSPVSSMEPMTVLPLSLVPTFFVPLLLMLHVISIAQARGWKEGSSTAPSEQRVAWFAGRGEQARAKA
jgi:hypothetical protein